MTDKPDKVNQSMSQVKRTSVTLDRIVAMGTGILCAVLAQFGQEGASLAVVAAGAVSWVMIQLTKWSDIIARHYERKYL